MKKTVGYEVQEEIDQGDAWLNSVDPKGFSYLIHASCAWNTDVLWEYQHGADITDLRKITREEAEFQTLRCGYCGLLLTEEQPFAFEHKPYRFGWEEVIPGKGQYEV